MKGHCLCGRVSYESGKPQVTAVCHCKHCQKQSGSAFSVVIAVPRASFVLAGPVETFEDVGDSGHPVLRRYCRDCGSPIVSELAVTPELVWLKAGTLEDTAQVQPTMQVYCASAQPWVALAGLESFAGMPEL
jgi:hypothetical protein